jgi:glycosyltransferase involved in cell wall biosynthesis
MPDVTVLLPVYNGARYLRESIDSVLTQSFANYELLILDDCSTDDSLDVVASYNDPRVRCYRNAERYGLFRTLNRGLQLSSSPWIRLWAHDDRMVPTCLERMYEFVCVKQDIGMVYCDFIEIDSAGDRTGNESEFFAMRQRTPQIANPRQSALLFFAFGCLPGNISTVMLNRLAWQEAGGFWEGKQQAPDYDMWVRVSEKRNVGFVREALVELREHPLQLGRVGQKLLTTIEEELPISEALCDRLEGIVTLRDCQRFWRDNRGRQHVHWMMKALLRRDLRTAMRGWRAISRYGQPYAQWCKWLISMNGRVLCEQPTGFFDLHYSDVGMHASSPIEGCGAVLT